MDNNNHTNNDKEELEDNSVNLIGKNRKIYTQPIDFDLETLKNKINSGRIIPNPTFQRRYVWDDKKASKLIESFLIDIPIPSIYLSEEEDNKLLVIDGQQRLISIKRYLINDFKLSLGRNHPLTGKYFKDLDEKYKNKLLSSYLRGIIIKKDSDPDLKFEIFARLNQGSVQLNDSEIRNCIFRGKYFDLLIELALNPTFKKLINYESWHKRMIYEELILRFFAFYNTHYTKYKGPMREFLNKEIQSKRDLEGINKNEMIKIFKKSIDLSYSVFGSKCFRRYKLDNNDLKERWENVPNKALYDVIMYGFTLFEKSQVIPCKDSIKEELIYLMTKDQKFIDSIRISTTSRKSIDYRFSKWEQSLREICNAPQSRAFSFALKKQLYDKNPYCAICNKSILTLDDAEIDHIEQYWRGGQTIPDNARLTHRYCNRARNKND
ncbi:MAG: HNH endonuclease family protein [Candidatus Helarchaeota archaeon]